MKLRPSEMLVSFLIHLQESKFISLYHQNELVQSVEQIEYDKFIIRMAYVSDREVRCDGLMISEFLDNVRDFKIL